jgi:hypothetical protein
MDTLVVTTALTVIVTWLLVTVVMVGQVALLVSTQLTTSLFTNAELLYVSLFIPTGEPFSTHW